MWFMISVTSICITIILEYKLQRIKNESNSPSRLSRSWGALVCNRIHYLYSSFLQLIRFWFQATRTSDSPFLRGLINRAPQRHKMVFWTHTFLRITSFLGWYRAMCKTFWRLSCSLDSPFRLDSAVEWLCTICSAGWLMPSEPPPFLIWLYYIIIFWTRQQKLCKITCFDFCISCRFSLCALFFPLRNWYNKYVVVV